ncbi:MAG: hypothetical protein HOW73_28355 [Polyangiaceae bacterium]|nr:hypothetical protein [Polyangiaceae bacterium]
MKLQSKIVALLTFGVIAALPTDAHAGGLVVDASKLEAKSRTSLATEIASSRSSLASVYAKVRDVQGVKPEVYSKFRNPVPTAGRELHALGKDALLPMLEVLAFDEAQTGLAAHEKEALTVGMLYAVGEIKDARAVPVLTSVLMSRSSSDPVAMAAASALGKMCRSSDVKLLAEQAKGGNARELAGIFGLGECRSKEAADALVVVIRSAKGDAAVQAVRALGNVGSSWVWAAKKDEGKAVRKLASDALVDAFAASSSLRKEASRAILKCDDEDALVRIRSAKDKASKAGRTADVTDLGDLEARIVKHRARK